jgi:lipoyl(octanoyl) transferase
MSHVCNVVRLGQIDYSTAWNIQRALADARATGGIDDTLLLLEHPHIYTLGRSAHLENLLFDADERARRGIALIEADRGGDVTYHGPGQLVAYPILYLGQADPTGRLVKADYVGYLRNLEEVLIRLLAAYGVVGERKDMYTGAWVETQTGPEKIAAIGVRVNARGISTHGTALNVTTDLSYFDGIIPCGIADYEVTSLQKKLDDNCPSIEDVVQTFIKQFAAVFHKEMQQANLNSLLPNIPV